MIDLQLQFATQSQNLPDSKRIEDWIRQACPDRDQVSVGIRLVDEQEGAELNERYRHKPGPTNVLSFPYESPFLPDDLEEGEDFFDDFLGDLVICVPVVEAEAAQQGKALDAHWAHMVVHGLLHLQGYDHIDDKQAEEMEQLERQILQRLGYPDPYQED